MVIIRNFLTLIILTETANVVIRVTAEEATEVKTEQILVKKTIIIIKIKIKIIVIIIVFIIIIKVFFKNKKLRRRLINSNKLVKLTVIIIYFFLKFYRLKRF